MGTEAAALEEATAQRKAPLPVGVEAEGVVEPNEAAAGVAVAAAEVAVEMGVAALPVGAGEADLWHHTHLKHTWAHTSTHTVRANTHTHTHFSIHAGTARYDGALS
jgi:hypothetical protein